MGSVAVALAGYLITKQSRFGKGLGYLGMFAGVVGIIAPIPTDSLPIHDRVPARADLDLPDGVRLIKLASST